MVIFGSDETVRKELLAVVAICRELKANWLAVYLINHDSQKANSLYLGRRVFTYKEKHNLTFEHTREHYGVNIAPYLL